ncbi:ABC transporter substrate-binding protein [Microbaculum marinum]|uniref:ABC transporter substrate-binding protein n=1 Tax=Microbaculum marinum TaxID=1764581 RepID=A0AAW9RYH6_9HYPH
MITRRQTLKGMALGAGVLAMPNIVRAQDMPKVKIGMSGWTGFAPLTLAEKAGLFKEKGVDVETVFISQKDRLAALAAGSVDGVATTVDTQILWATTVPLTQILILDKSKGGDGIAVRKDIDSFEALKGKSIACDAAGTTPYFMLAAMLQENGMSIKDMNLSVLSPKDAANAFVAGQFDAAATYEPYLSTVRNDPDAGKILATTVDYPVVVDTLAFPTETISGNSETYQKIVDGFFAALQMIADKPEESFGIMGERVNMDAKQFEGSAQFIDWQDQAENKAYFADGLAQFMEMAVAIQFDNGVIREKPDLSTLTDASFVS